MINRGAVILRYREPAVRWINEADPYEDNPGFTLESVNHERTVYLISDRHTESVSTMRRWVRRHYRKLFEAELEGGIPTQSCGQKSERMSAFKPGLTWNTIASWWRRQEAPSVRTRSNGDNAGDESSLTPRLCAKARREESRRC